MLTLHFHPLSSFCHKVLIALYENGTPFTPKLVDLGDAEQRDAFRALWPVGKFPVLQDDARGETVPELSIIIEYLDQHYPGKTRLIPAEPEQSRAVRFRDRFFDLHIHLHMQKIVGDRLRPAGAKDPHGVEDARTRMAAALGIVEKEMASRDVIKRLGRRARASHLPTARRRRRCSMRTRSRRSPASIRTSSPISID